MSDLDDLFRDIDRPRPLPESVRLRLERALIARAELAAEQTPGDELVALLPGLDTSRPLPARTRARLEKKLVASRHGAPIALRRLLALAAALLLIAAGGVILVRAGRAPSGGLVSPPFFTPSGPRTSPHPPTGAQPTTSPSGRATQSPPPAGEGPGPPPPFYLAFGSAPQGSGAPRPGDPLRVGVIPGDKRAEAGFRAYVRLLNEGGGVRGHLLELVPVGPSDPARRTIATVNLSGRPVATIAGPPSWAGRLLLEGLAVDESVLKNPNVFGLASAAERQGHLVADAFSGGGGVPATVALYEEPEGLLGGRVPDEITKAFERRGSTVLRVTYRPEDPTPLFIPADLAVLSLGSDSALAWFRDAATVQYTTTRGVAGIYSLYEESLLPSFRQQVTILSPYRASVVPGEMAALENRIGSESMGAAAIHGWVTAKAIAVSIWKSDAETQNALRTALARLTGFKSGFFDPYEVRPGTHSRTPEAVVISSASGRFFTSSGFRRDPD